MKPQNSLIFAIVLIAISLIFQNLDVSAKKELLFTIQSISLATSFLLLLRFALSGLSIQTDNPMLVNLFITGFIIAGFATVGSSIAIISFFRPDLFYLISHNAVIYGSIIGQLLFIGGFAVNGTEEVPL